MSTNEQALPESAILAGMAALLQCAQSELSDYAPKLFAGYEDDVKRVYRAVSEALPAVEAVTGPSDAIKALMQQIDEHGSDRWATGASEQAKDTAAAKRADAGAVKRRARIAAMVEALARFDSPPVAAPADGFKVVPAYWESRHFDATGYPGGWSEWQKVEPRQRNFTVDDRLQEFRDYIARGDRYELRQLFAATPTPAAATTDGAAEVVPAELDVRKIMLDITPGEDGMGYEVYAKSVNDVVDRLSKIDAELEEWQLGIRRLPAAATTTSEAAVTEAQASGVYAKPQHDKCPITGRPYFMTIEHPDLGMVETFGGPFDSYTIPTLDGEPTDPWHTREMQCERYDHDLGGWRLEDAEHVPLRIIHEEVLFDLQTADEKADPSQAHGKSVVAQKTPSVSDHAVCGSQAHGNSEAVALARFMGALQEVRTQLKDGDCLGASLALVEVERLIDADRAQRPAALASAQGDAAQPEGYTARVIEALYENGDPVSVDAAEELKRLAAIAAPQPAPASQEALTEAALAWWEVHRPANWSAEQHRKNPEVNCTSMEAADLAKACAALQAEKGGGHNG